MHIFDEGRTPAHGPTGNPTGFPVFVYGTLRPGGALASLMPSTDHTRAVLPGRLYRHFGARFPVLRGVDESEYSLVVGDLFTVDKRRASQLDHVIDMEVGAGYDVKVREVWQTATGLSVSALTFMWPDTYEVGPRIYSGDWFSVEASEVCAELSHNAGFTGGSYGS